MNIWFRRFACGSSDLIWYSSPIFPISKCSLCTHDVWFGCRALFFLVCLHFKISFSNGYRWNLNRVSHHAYYTHLIGQLFIFACTFSANFHIHQNDSINICKNKMITQRKRFVDGYFPPSMRINVPVFILTDLSWKEIILCGNNEIFPKIVQKYMLNMCTWYSM